MPWDDNKKDRLKTLWVQGLPTRQIAAELETTNGAVAGQARRLKLPFRAGPQASLSGHSAFSKREARKRKKPDNPFGGSKVFERAFQRIEEKMLAKDAGRIGVPLLVKRDGLLHANEALHSRACKWPIAEGFCGRHAVNGVSYCEPHLRRSSSAPIRIPQSALPLVQHGQLLLFGFLEPLTKRYEAA